MPRVAISDNAVGIAEPTQARFQAVDNGGGALGGIAAGLGETARSVGAFAEQEQASQHIYNEAAAKQAYTTADEQVRSLLYTGDKAFYQQQGAGAIDAQKPTMEALGKARSDAYGSLKNPQQQRMFAEAFDARLGEERAKIATHVNQELRVYGNQQSQARQAGAQNNALDNADNPELYGRFVTTGENEIRAQAGLNGWGDDVTNEKIAEYRSGTAAKVADAKMTADPVGAAAWVASHGDTILPADRARLSASLYQPLLERRASADVDAGLASVAGGPSPVTPLPASGGSVAARVVAITANSESGGRERDASGKLVTSPVGAQGKMQVMPATARDPGYGVKPAQDGSDAERSRVGTDLILKFNSLYGDPAKAWAAYNWSKGGVDKCVQQYGSDWLAHCPKETQSYVTSNMAMLGTQGQKFAPRRDDLNGIYQWIQAQPWDYDRKKAALAEADQRVARDDHLQQRAQKDAQDQAYTIINGLGDKYTSISQLPPAVRQNLTPEMTHSLIAQAEQNAAPKAVPADGDTVIKLRQLAALQPDAFAKTDLRQYRPFMTPGEYASIAVEQAKQQANPGQSTQYNRIWQGVNFYGRDAGVDMSPQKKNEASDAFHARLADGNKLFTMVQNSLDTVTGGKRPATDQEIKAAFDNALIYRRQADGGPLMGRQPWQTEDHAVPRFREPGMQANSIAVPTSQRSSIIAALRRAGQPTDEQTIARAYLRSQGRR